LLLGGIYLATLGGSLYYVMAGLAYLIAGFLLWRRQASGAWVLILIVVLTIPWALWESGTFYWALFPRLLVSSALASVGLLLLPSELPEAFRGTMRGPSVLAVLGTIAFFALAFVPTGVVSPIPNSRYAQAAATVTPSDWSAYGRTTAGTRYAPFTQINRNNVKDLKLAWTPLRWEDFAREECRRFECAFADRQYAVHVYTRWSHRRARRGLGGGALEVWYPQFLADLESLSWPELLQTQGSSANGVCAERIVNSTIDARLFELDAKTGKPCADFGSGGIVDLKHGMGEVKPGFCFRSSAALVARDYIIIGGWVVDNYSRGEPSGVIHAFDAQNGSLVWQYALPVGSSATPISYVSQETGKQYIARSVGGAAHSVENGDYVVAFSLPGTQK
jgi:quinate dehydrogenase (quinone)